LQPLVGAFEGFKRFALAVRHGGERAVHVVDNADGDVAVLGVDFSLVSNNMLLRVVDNLIIVLIYYRVNNFLLGNKKPAQGGQLL
jgi:hypothetical protein